MADNVLKGLFGSGGETGAPDRDKAKDFVSRYEQGDPTEGYSTDEAVDYFRQATQHASPEQLDRAVKQSVDKLNPNQREEFAKMLQERQSGQVQRPMTEGGGSSDNPLDALGGLLGGSGGGGIGGLLGGLLGGGSSSNAGSMFGGDNDNRSGGGGSGGMGGLGDILGSSVGKAVLAGAAAFAMKEIMDKN